MFSGTTPRDRLRPATTRAMRRWPPIYCGWRGIPTRRRRSSFGPQPCTTCVIPSGWTLVIPSMEIGTARRSQAAERQPGGSGRRHEAQSRNCRLSALAAERSLAARANERVGARIRRHDNGLVADPRRNSVHARDAAQQQIRDEVDQGQASMGRASAAHTQSFWQR